MEANKEDMLAEISTRMDANAKDMKSNQVEMRSTVHRVSVEGDHPT
jgi:hypothetical protein